MVREEAPEVSEKPGQAFAGRGEENEQKDLLKELLEKVENLTDTQAEMSRRLSVFESGKVCGKQQQES
jgi:hypothetical protein